MVAALGAPLEWIRGEGRGRFWEDELAPHLVEPGPVAEVRWKNGFPVEFYTESEWWRPDGAVVGYRLDEFPDEYVYVAVEWRLDTGAPVVVATQRH